jgi:two-component system chemotaxis response regulator CheB
LIGLFAGLTHPLDMPVMVSQHIAEGFDDGLMEWLNRETSHAEVKIGLSGEKVKAGTIYLSPANGNMEITSRGMIEISPFVSGDIYTPSCDKLFESVARTYGASCVAIVLTGMGDDGTRGAQAVKRAGGRTIGQDEASCVVYGMPKAALESGCIDEEISLNDIGRYLNGLIRES